MHNILKFLTNLLTSCFFHTLRDAWKFFSHKYSIFLQQIATASLQKCSQIIFYYKSTRHSRHSKLQAIRTCVFQYNMRHGWKKYKESPLQSIQV